MSIEDFENGMGEITRLAYSKIKEISYNMDKELDLNQALDFLEAGNNFKKISDLLKETIIKAGIPKDTPEKLKETGTVSEFLKSIESVDNSSKINETDSLDCYKKSLYALLDKQEKECKYVKRKNDWDKKTIGQWLEDAPEKDSNKSDSIEKQNDAIAVCFALGLDYDATQEFLNKCGHMILNIRIPEDAVYSYCLFNHRPLSTAKFLINEYYKKNNNDITKEELLEYKIPSTNSGNTTSLLIKRMFEESNWEDDDSFLNTFLLPNKENFISFSNCALREFLKLKVPIFINVLWNMYTDVQSKKYATTLYNLLYEYSDKSEVIRSTYEAYSRHLSEYDEDDMDDNTLANVFVDISDGISYSTISTDELLVISYFLQKLLSPNEFLNRVMPMLSRSGNKNYGKYKVKLKDRTVWMDKKYDEYWIETLDNEFIRNISKEDFNRLKKIKGNTKNETRSMNMSDSSIGKTALKSFPNQQFYADYLVSPEIKPQNIVLRQRIPLRKAIMFLFYLNYVFVYRSELAGPFQEELEFDFERFIEKLNNILGKCQLGKLYPGNQYDWLILFCAENDDVGEEKDDSYVAVLNKILELSVS